MPGDVSSDLEVFHGGSLRVPALEGEFHDAGIYLPDGTHDGHAVFSDAAKAQLCALLTPWSPTIRVLAGGLRDADKPWTARPAQAHARSPSDPVP